MGVVGMMQLLTIARNTFVESIRQPIYVVLLLFASGLLVLNTSLAAYTLDNDNKIMVDMGLSTLFLAGLLLAAFTATGVLSAEVESRTVLTVVSKPVARPLFVLGKFVGVGTALALAYWALMLIFLLTVRHQVMQRASDPYDLPVILFGVLAGAAALLGATLVNYLYHRVFASAFVLSYAALLTVAYLLVLMIGRDWRFQAVHTDLNIQLLTVLLLVFEAVLILTAVAIACSTRLGQVMTLVVCTLVFLMGLVSHYFSGQTDRTFADMEQTIVHQVMYWLLKSFFFLLPNLQYLWQADALSQGRPISLEHVLLLSGYSIFYIGAILAAAVALFQTREVG